MIFLVLASFNSQRDGILPISSHIIMPKTNGFNSQRDGILRFARIGTCVSYALVSIPNGMEFYRTEKLFPSFRNCFNSQRDGILRLAREPAVVTALFQFPTGWNSTEEFSFKDEAYRRFNSQRDGILLPLALLGLDDLRVSIPNGMEFYKPRAAFRTRDKSVLIPNGMEFYFADERNERRRSTFQFPTGWNSTINSTRKRTFFIVSIPNGMEFYGFIEKCSNGYKSFNSQRDGILLFVSLHLSLFRLFQFPTGWNSTPFARFILARTPVSIPNGMEFYEKFIATTSDKICFNSQRDGILPISGSQQSGNKQKFQFPTGWNSTSVSQSTVSKPKLVSIPNGMEFYNFQ